LSTDCAGEVELLAGRPETAEELLRPGYDVLVALDSRNFLSTVAARLAEAVVEQGRMDEADELTRVSEDATADDDILSNIMWRCVRARCRLARAPEESLALVDRAVALARSVESPSFLATALLEQARILQRVGEHEPAGAQAREARALFDVKGFTVGVSRADELLTLETTAENVVDLLAAYLPSQRTALSHAETAVSPA
jgi:ATP/maltotriose-dependent transcriptional regulator MalT